MSDRENISLEELLAFLDRTEAEPIRRIPALKEIQANMGRLRATDPDRWNCTKAKVIRATVDVQLEEARDAQLERLKRLQREWERQYEPLEVTEGQKQAIYQLLDATKGQPANAFSSYKDVGRELESYGCPNGDSAVRQAKRGAKRLGVDFSTAEEFVSGLRENAQKDEISHI